MVFNIGRKTFEVIKEITTEKNQTYVVNFKNKPFVLRKFNNLEEYKEALYRYKKLVKYSIYTPTLEYKDKNEYILVFNHIDSPHADEVLAKEELPEIYFEKLFTLYRYARANQVDINYLPENFALDGKRLYYTSLDLFNAKPEINLENYGLEFWIMSKKGYEHLTKLGYEIDKKRLLSSAETNKKIVLLSLYNW